MARLAAGDEIQDKKNKVKVCHHTGNGSHNVIEIAEPAVQAHLNHGDSLLPCPGGGTGTGTTDGSTTATGGTTTGTGTTSGTGSTSGGTGTGTNGGTTTGGGSTSPYPEVPTAEVGFADSTAFLYTAPTRSRRGSLRERSSRIAPPFCADASWTATASLSPAQRSRC